MAESGVTLPADSTGKALRTAPVTTTFTSGAGGTVHQQVVVPAAVDGSVLEVTPFGAAHFENPSHLILADQFNGGTIDTAQWSTTSSTVTPSQASGSVTLTLPTTASAISLLAGVPTLPMQFVSQFAIRADFGTTQPTNNHRFIGMATGNTTAASPIIDGVGFEMTTGGVFRAVIYAGSAVVASATLTTPTTSNVYLMLVKPGWVAFYVGSFSNPVAVLTGFSPANELLPVRVHSINATTAATSAPTLIVGGLAVSDGGENSMGVGDGVYPWRKATVKAASTAAAATDTALSVALHPSSPVPLPALVKGTQSNNGVATQDLKDSGRTLFFASGTVTPTAGTEALVSITPYRTGLAGSAATQVGVTTGKTLRLTGMTLTVRQAATPAIGGAALRLRIGTGTLTVSSALVSSIATNITSATANVPSSVDTDFPDGIEMASGTTLVFALSLVGTAHPCDVTIYGFEY